MKYINAIEVADLPAASTQLEIEGWDRYWPKHKFEKVSLLVIACCSRHSVLRVVVDEQGARTQGRRVEWVHSEREIVRAREWEMGTENR